MMSIHYFRQPVTYGATRLGSRGNNEALLMLPSLRKSMTTRSRPNRQILDTRLEISLLTDTSTSVGRSTESESVQVALHRGRVDSNTPHSLLQIDRVVNSLGT